MNGDRQYTKKAKRNSPMPSLCNSLGILFAYLHTYISLESAMIH